MVADVREAMDQSRKAAGQGQPSAGRLQRAKTLRHTREHLSSYSTKEVPDLVDMEAWRRYCTLLSVFQLYGRQQQGSGLRVQGLAGGGGW